jgi:hypothetical protein
MSKRHARPMRPERAQQGPDLDMELIIGAVIRRTPGVTDADVNAALAALSAAARGMGGPYTVESIRESYRRGFLDVDPAGRAIVTRPVVKLGVIVGRLPVSDTEQLAMARAAAPVIDPDVIS